MNEVPLVGRALGTLREYRCAKELDKEDLLAQISWIDAVFAIPVSRTRRQHALRSSYGERMG